jgi:hypothetical protein
MAAQCSIRSTIWVQAAYRSSDIRKTPCMAHKSPFRVRVHLQRYPVCSTCIHSNCYPTCHSETCCTQIIPSLHRGPILWQLHSHCFYPDFSSKADPALILVMSLLVLTIEFSHMPLLPHDAPGAYSMKLGTSASYLKQAAAASAVSGCPDCSSCNKPGRPPSSRTMPRRAFSFQEAAGREAVPTMYEVRVV